jgi:RNA polymerase sigma factor (sigma-70 family)
VTAEPLAFVLHYLRRRADAESLAALSDGQLLERFTSRRDDAAFAALVERSGGLVWGACRRLLASTQDAEDAFQATFLVLARRAKALDRRGPLCGWLHTVAHRIALKARADGGRRREHERRAILATGGPLEPRGDWVGTRCGQVLDEELQRLPARYRLPLLLCYLERKTNVQATFGRGQTLVAGAVSGRAIAWTEALLRGILMTKVKVLAAVLFTLGLAGGVLLAQRAVSDELGEEPTPPAPVMAADAEPTPVGPRRGGELPVPLRHGDVPVGSLGYPLGASLTVQGTRAEGQKVEAQMLLVDTVSGIRLKEPTAIWVQNVRELPKDTRIVLKAYETGRMDGPVPHCN